MTVQELKTQCNRVLLVAQMLAQITSTKADDEAVAFFLYVVNDTEIMEKAKAWLDARRGQPVQPPVMPGV